MVESAQGERKSLARKLAQALVEYKASFDEWCRSPHKLDFGRVDRQMDAIRVLRMGLPQVATGMVRVLIAHTDLSVMHIRMRTGGFGGPPTADALKAAECAHATAVEAMRLHCMKLGE